MKIKTCGLFREEDIEYANILQPDFIGFVFAKSSREVDFGMAKKLKSRLNSNIKAVGVFVDTPIELIYKALDSKIIDIVQLHGGQSAEFIADLKAKIKAKIIYVINMTNLDSIDYTKCDLVDFLLLDSAQGGSGKCFDWNLLKNIHLPKPYFLAGGINKENLAQAMAFNPYGIDVSGGLEHEGKKDFSKMKEIISRVRRYKSDIKQ
ncbi:phosphoribosylanthranilate isomerase [uncultured Helicobacter sp.]|uniref:phosphoribosylanthranilate isomerase n=1 Tax=uncultured Helicobacter sp. TaxID=175537 RepID=UPI002591FE3F|nr:phosphoribosylanthranilate isomerase [uncultured Helicobacter sp.]